MGYWYILHFYGFYIKPMRMLGSRNKNWLLIPLVGINTVYVWIKFNIMITQEHTKLVGKENPSVEGKIMRQIWSIYYNKIEITILKLNPKLEFTIIWESAQ